MNRIISSESKVIGSNEVSNLDGLSSMLSSHVYSFLILSGTDRNHINFPTAYKVYTKENNEIGTVTKCLTLNIFNFVKINSNAAKMIQNYLFDINTGSVCLFSVAV